MKGRTFESREELAILEKAMNPTGGAYNIRRVDRSQTWNTGGILKLLGEPHSADPLAMWCGERKTPPYPIRWSPFYRFMMLVA